MCHRKFQNKKKWNDIQANAEKMKDNAILSGASKILFKGKITKGLIILIN